MKSMLYAEFGVSIASLGRLSELWKNIQEQQE